MTAISRAQYSAMLRAGLAGALTFHSLGALGANVFAPASTSGNAIFTNAFYNGARMCKTGQPGVNCTRDATTGWPTEAFYVCLAQAQSNGTVLVDGAISAGTYNWSFSYLTAQGATTVSMTTTGANTPLNSGVSGFTTGTPVVVGGTTTVPFSFTLTSQGTVTLTFSNAITFCDCPIDGQATVVGQPVHRAVALAYYSQFGAIRTLDMLQTNTRFDIDWTDRPPNYTGPQLAQDILSWERVIAFALAVKNYPGSNCRRWLLNIPPYANDAYATNLATLCNTLGVPAGFIKRSQYGNEPWNFGGTLTVRFHGYENAAMSNANGIASYELTANASAPSALYKGPGITITGMSIDTTGLCTVTLNVACSSLLDAGGQPFIVNGATAIVSAAANIFNAGGLAADVSRTVPISNVSGSTFQYTTGVAGAGSSTLGSTQIYFNPTASLLADNLSFSIANMQKKWLVARTFAAAQNWQTVRPKATYGDEWEVNLQAYGGAAPGASKNHPFEYTYATYLGGGSIAWLDAMSVANYSKPAGLTAALDDLYNPAMSTSLYAALNGPAVALSVDNETRAHVWECITRGIRPASYEGGMALQTDSGSDNFVVAASTDPRTETYLLAHQSLVLQQGVEQYMQYHASPGTFKNGVTGNGSWQSLQSFGDSINSGDTNYSAKHAAIVKQRLVLATYSNISGSDLTSLDASVYQNATDLCGAAFSVALQGTTGAAFWSAGATAVARNIDWVYCNNLLTPRLIFVEGTDSQATAVQVWMFALGSATPTLLGTVHLPANGITNAATASTVGACLDPITWTPTSAGPFVLRAILVAGAGTGPGIRRLRLA